MRRFVPAVVALVIASCGGAGMAGVYVADGKTPTNPIAKIELKADGQLFVTGATEVELNGMKVPVNQGGGMTKAGTYKVQDGKLTATVGTDAIVMTITADGCLDAGGPVGKFCKK